MSDQLDHIERYLIGELSQQELAAFKAELLVDESLKEKVENHRQFLKGLEIGFNKELKSFLVEEETKIRAQPTKEPKRVKSFYILFGMAAAVALLIVSVFVLRTQPISQDELFAQYYQTYPNVEQPVSRSENNANNPYALYEQGAYEKALILFSDIHASDPENAALPYYSALCHLELGQAKEAIEFLDQVVVMQSDKYSRPATWYLSLSYLKSGNTKKTKAILKQLQLEEDVYADKAKGLLENL